MSFCIKFYSELGKLKRLPRTGWVNRGIPNPESIADHTFRSQIIARDFAVAVGANPEEICELMLFHDFPEARAGDIAPSSRMSADEKLSRELDAARQLVELGGDPKILDLFKQYADKETSIAKIGNDADKLECVLQAIEYAEMYPEKRKSLEGFFPYAEQKLLTDVGKKSFEILEKKWRMIIA